jgi:hypothetical protein
MVGSVGAVGYTVLLAEYSFPGREEEEHVFTHVQASFRGAVDQYIYGIPVKEEQQQQQNLEPSASKNKNKQAGER